MPGFSVSDLVSSQSNLLGGPGPESSTSKHTQNPKRRENQLAVYQNAVDILGIFMKEGEKLSKEVPPPPHGHFFPPYPVIDRSMRVDEMNKCFFPPIHSPPYLSDPLAYGSIFGGQLAFIYSV